MSSCGKITEVHLKILIPIALTLVYLCSCSSPVKVEGFDHESWKADTNACQMTRANLVNTLLQHKDVFINKKDDQLTKYIGQPDKTLFFSRGKKTFIYQVDPGKNCENRFLVKNVRTVRFDIDALGRIDLVYMISQ
ncbi:MAG TPA: hypothetical protein VK750_09055 [Cytophagaceae bacterium]|jgi:hypothetical protein|nr:hypothetical protein [Cytophagaceae bacterium]